MENEEQLVCGICEEDFQKQGCQLPRVFPCSSRHTFCTGCILKLNKCATCQENPLFSFDEKHLPPPNLARLELLTFSETRQKTPRIRGWAVLIGVLVAAIGAILFLFAANQRLQGQYNQAIEDGKSAKMYAVLFFYGCTWLWPPLGVSVTAGMLGLGTLRAFFSS